MADQAINALSTKTTPATSDQLLLVGPGEPQLIDYDKLADAILNKITSKNYTLDAGTMTLPAALNALNGKSFESYSLGGDVTTVTIDITGISHFSAAIFGDNNTEAFWGVLGTYSSSLWKMHCFIGECQIYY